MLCIQHISLEAPRASGTVSGNTSSQCALQRGVTLNLLMAGASLEKLYRVACKLATMLSGWRLPLTLSNDSLVGPDYTAAGT